MWTRLPYSSLQGVCLSRGFAAVTVAPRGHFLCTRRQAVHSSSRDLEGAVLIADATNLACIAGRESHLSLTTAFSHWLEFLLFTVKPTHAFAVFDPVQARAHPQPVPTAFSHCLGFSRCASRWSSLPTNGLDASRVTLSSACGDSHGRPRRRRGGWASLRTTCDGAAQSSSGGRRRRRHDARRVTSSRWPRSSGCCRWRHGMATRPTTTAPPSALRRRQVVQVAGNRALRAWPAEMRSVHPAARAKHDSTVSQTICAPRAHERPALHGHEAALCIAGACRHPLFGAD
jgi:hypothetical protein